MKGVLLKAKRTDNGEWIYWNAFGEICNEHSELRTAIVTVGNVDKTYNDIHSMLEFIDIATLCRFTGAFDKDGNLIWECSALKDEDGTILVVRWDDDDRRFVLDEYGYSGRLMEYGWDEDAGDFETVDTHGFNDFSEPVNKTCTVVGNTFDVGDLEALASEV